MRDSMMLYCCIGYAHPSLREGNPFRENSPYGKNPYAMGLISITSHWETKVYIRIHVATNKAYQESKDTRVGTLIVATIYLQLIQNRYMF